MIIIYFLKSVILLKRQAIYIYIYIYICTKGEKQISSVNILSLIIEKV